MIIDARKLPADETLDTDVCIVGAGPSGITLAREFANQNFRVCLVESGGFEFEKDIQSLCEGEVIGDPYPSLTETRRRQFGGNAHFWRARIGYEQFGFRCLPLDTIDFEQREWIPYSGWPFTRSDLDPFYERAHKVCQLGPFTYKVEDWKNSRASPLPFKSKRLITSISQYASRYPFTHEYREEIKQADNITILLHANVMEIETDGVGKTVTSLRIHGLGGNNQFWLAGKVFILATGGIENPRLLLLSNKINKAGIGNQNDLVGRFFIDRPRINCGTLIPDHRQLFDMTDLYDIRNINGVPIMANIMLNEELMRQEKLMNNGAQLLPKPQAHQIEAIDSLKQIILSIHHAKLPSHLQKHLINIVHSGDYLTISAFWAIISRLPGLRHRKFSYFPYEKRKFSHFEVIYQIEQAPDPTNRVMLSTDRDYLGQNKVEIHWQLNDIDIRTVKRVQEIWKEEFAQSGLGELHLEHEVEGFKFHKAAASHHIGTTRMHIDPKQGVVDPNCLVHDMTNLFIAGSSVFPTIGYANPTLTIIALAIRLADHIKTLI